MTNRPQSQWIQNFSKFLATNALLKYFVAMPLDEQIDKKLSNFPTENDISEEAEPSEPDVRAGNEKTDDKQQSDWTIFVRFIDRIFFIILCFCYKLYNG